MRRSSPILPIRIYDDLFDQQRFNIHSAIAEQMDLVFPAHQLPSFQFTRQSSLAAPSKFFLRNVCEDESYNYGWYKQVPEPANIFSTVASEEFFPDVPKIGGVFDDGVNPSFGGFFEMGKYQCNKLVNTDVDPNWTILSTMGEFVIPLTASPESYTFKIIVDKFKRSSGSTFKLKIFTGGTSGTLIGTISAPGIYTYTFTSAGADVTIGFENYQQGDMYEISYVQAVINTNNSLLSSDVSLNELAIKVVPMKDGTDILSFCQATQNYAPSPGYYYYVINIDSTLFFSEVFKIVSLREIESYYQLTWRHTCDINNAVIYRSSVLLCTFTNVLYLDAALFKPEPETSTDGNTTGDGDFNISIVTWKNFLNFEILKSPQFLTDALSAILLHDTITIKKPLNVYQEINSNIITVKSVVPEVTPVLQDSFSKVNLKILLEDYFTRTGCCNEAEIFTGGSSYRYSASAPPCTEGTEYTLQLSETPTEGDGLYECASGNLIEPSETDLILFNSQYIRLTLLDGIWQPLEKIPNIAAVELGETIYHITGKVLPWTFARIQYNKDSAGWTDVAELDTNAEGTFAYDILSSSVEDAVTDYKLRVQCITIDEELAYSDVLDII